ncbi:hypothetical protein OG763_15050 [Streptomyces sp. NBC_01230]|uniref:hypothetical protein n=1 Tax=Streptomyces sp. NBC_01230 TaxID=2903784 RepID=UPI002E13DB11|nr:hypothetical protein OG763_15050 [Streptomyces sp. NBC_01230]
MDLRPRALIQRLNSSTTVTEPDDTDEAGTDPVVTIPAQPVRGGGRLPNWWEPKRDVVDLDKQAPAEEPCERPHPHAVHASLTGQLVPYWCEDCDTQLPVPEDMEDDEYEEEEEDEEGEKGGDKVPARVRRGWNMRGSGERVYSRPTYNRGKPPKRSLVEAWSGLSPLTRHGLYNGSALALGFSLGVPQFFTAETAYLAATYASWTDFYVCVWYGVAIAIWMFDQRTRNWLPLLALAARVLLVSVIVGVLLYGTPA